MERLRGLDITLDDMFLISTISQILPQASVFGNHSYWYRIATDFNKELGKKRTTSDILCRDRFLEIFVWYLANVKRLNRTAANFVPDFRAPLSVLDSIFEAMIGDTTLNVEDLYHIVSRQIQQIEANKDILADTEPEPERPIKRRRTTRPIRIAPRPAPVQLHIPPATDTSGETSREANLAALATAKSEAAEAATAKAATVKPKKVRGKSVKKAAAAASTKKKRQKKEPAPKESKEDKKKRVWNTDAKKRFDKLLGFVKQPPMTVYFFKQQKDFNYIPKPVSESDVSEMKSEAYCVSTDDDFLLYEKAYDEWISGTENSRKKQLALARVYYCDGFKYRPADQPVPEPLVGKGKNWLAKKDL